MTEREQTHIFAQNLNKCIAESGKTQREIAKGLGVSPTTLNNWCREVSMPKTGVIQNIADYFGIGKTALLDEQVECGETDAIILKKLRQLTPENKKVVLSTIDAMISTQINS